MQPRGAELCSRCSRCARFRPGTALWPGVVAGRSGQSRVNSEVATLAAADGPTSEAEPGPGEDGHLDAGVAHIARVYNYWLGGADYFPADRAAAEATIAAYPGIQLSAQANRAFLARSVRYLAEAEEIRQFLDVGTGLPTANNTHQVA